MDIWSLLATVFISILILWSLSLITKYREYLADKAYGEKHGCQEPPNIVNELPLGVDRLEQIFRANREDRLMELFLFHFRQTGNTLKQVFLGTKAFGTIEPRNLECILSSKFDDFGMGPRHAIMEPLFGEGIFTQEGADWKRSRNFLRPQFNHKQYQNLDVFREHVDNLLDIVANSDGVVDLQPLFFRLTLDTTTAFLFGDSVDSLKASQTIGEETFADSFNTAQAYIAKRYRLLDLYWFIGGLKFRTCCAAVHRFADYIIDRSLEKNKNAASNQQREKYLLLDVVAKNSKDRKALRDQMINILGAGRDTTACLLAWTFYLLVRHPLVLDRVRAEIASITSQTSELSRNELRKMHYLQNILKETLRLYPTVPVNSRSALRTTILPTGGGPDRSAPVLIRRGMAVAYSAYSLHRREDLFGEDAEQFRPERWEEDMGLHKDETTAAWGYIPFNGGPRICLVDFALTEAAYTVVRILERFPSIEIPEDEEIKRQGQEKQEITIVIAPAEGCRVKIA